MGSERSTARWCAPPRNAVMSGPPLSVRSCRAAHLRAAPEVDEAEQTNKETTVSEIRVTIDRQAERAERTVTTGTTVGDLFAAEFGGDRSNIAARLHAAGSAHGVLIDLARPLADGDVIAPVAIDSEDGRAILRHSTAHVMAQAVQEVFPEA